MRDRPDASSGRPRQPFVAVPVAANVQEYTGVEGGYMIYRSGWYYLFGSYDYCCQGAASTYNVRVGRSRTVDGPSWTTWESRCSPEVGDTS